MDLHFMKWLIYMMYYMTICRQGIKSDVTVFPNAITVIEWDNATIRCKYDGENSIQGGLFFLDKKSVATVYVSNCTFNVLNKDRYKTDCDGNKTLVLTIVNISRTDHDKSISCRLIANSVENSTNSAKLLVNVQSDFTIEPSVLDEIESYTAIFKCLNDGSVVTIRWETNNNIICNFKIDECESYKSTTDGKFKCSCVKNENDTVLSLQISNITRADHNTSFECLIFSMTALERKNATLYVKVPVKTLNIIPQKSTIETSENTTFQFTCNSSESRPIPEITWTLADQKDTRLQLFGNQTNFTDTNGFTSAINTLHYQANRIFNGWKLYCIVTKSDVQQKELQSRFIKLNVTYPPDSKLMINGFDKDVHYAVIANDIGNLICTIIGGNPTPFLKWNKCFDNENYTRISGSYSQHTETYKLFWHATPQTDRHCTCQSMQKERNDSVPVFVEVLYPPTIPTFKYGSSEVSGIIYILRNEQIRLECESDSKPTPTYQWILNNGTKLASKTLLIQNTHTTDQGQYSCTAMNKMNATNITKTGSNNSNIELQVLYPPSVDGLTDHTVVEKDHVNISCPITFGNPSETIFRWTSAGKKTWPSRFLTIRNVSRNDDMNYNCSIYNIMTPTGKSPVNGTDSGMFHLTVEYNATVKGFFVNDNKSGNDVTVNESDNVTFSCEIDSKPISNTSLRFGTHKTLLWTESNFLMYTNVAAKCTDAGSYFCYGRNKHNKGINSKEKVNLFVRCSPRINPNHPYKVNITSALNVSASLQIPIQAYPTLETVVWQKFTASNWTNITSYNNISISGIEHNVSLTFNNVSETDFGRYRVFVSNDAGLYTSEFYIIAEDRPKPPTGFRIIDKLTTTTTATVQWFPSFDGGRPQTFVLNYSRSHQNYWTQNMKQDTRELIMNYTIIKLSSSSTYYIILHSENSIGSSVLSERLEVHTKDIPETTEESLIGVVIGSLCGVIGALLIIAFVIYFFKKRCRLKYQQKNSNSENDLPNQYESLDGIQKDSNHYSELQQVQKRHKDFNIDRYTDAGSENLEIDHEKAIYINMKI